LVIGVLARALLAIAAELAALRAGVAGIVRGKKEAVGAARAEGRAGNACETGRMAQLAAVVCPGVVF
jgi:hypothetical protein